jgi:hypothetical protein
MSSSLNIPESPTVSGSRELLDSLVVYHLDKTNPSGRELTKATLDHPEAQVISFLTTNTGSVHNDMHVQTHMLKGDRTDEGDISLNAPLMRMLYDVVEVPESASVKYKYQELQNKPRVIPIFLLEPFTIDVQSVEAFKAYSFTNAFNGRLQERVKAFLEGEYLFMNGKLFREI